MEVLPELSRSVVVEVAVHGRIFLQISYRLCSDARSASQCFSPSKSKIVTVVLSVFLYPIVKNSLMCIKHEQPCQMMVLVKKYGVLG